MGWKGLRLSEDQKKALCGPGARLCQRRGPEALLHRAALGPREVFVCSWVRTGDARFAQEASPALQTSPKAQPLGLPSTQASGKVKPGNPATVVTEEPPSSTSEEQRSRAQTVSWSWVKGVASRGPHVLPTARVESFRPLPNLLQTRKSTAEKAPCVLRFPHVASLRDGGVELRRSLALTLRLAFNRSA